MAAVLRARLGRKEAGCALGFPGADPTLRLRCFVVPVALGIDSNVFLMARVREEAIRHGTREGTRRASP